MNTATAPEFELVLPCYNESRGLARLVERAVEAARAAGRTPRTFRLVLVENGSVDDSRRVMDDLKTEPAGEWFRIVQVPVNQGYGYGVWQGLQTTTARFVGWSHSDLQCDPNDAFKALALLESGGPAKRLVKGRRLGRDWKDRVVSAVFARMARLILGVGIDEINAQPKVFPATLKQEIVDPPKDFAFDVYVLYRALRAGYEIQTIPVFFPPRVHGVSNWAATFAGRYKTIAKMIRYMVSLRLR